ncbi:neural Wiskott-Aldrich syndrome protein [Nematostella vectensis]|uniref:neural Wiskott-Aldrich syndrome protein n=1 Tax=Nematostella vectensis TaxID=45351 RepID=UPI00138FDE4C|nr:neural Wiskott-Aldrich syndrome protein [Nematostella vectensis]
MGTIKSGWLKKLSGFFKNTWKDRYFVLYQNGDFCYYQDPKDTEVDGRINMRSECKRIAVGNSVGDGVQKAPKDIDTLFSVVSIERTWFLVAESASDARDWVAALQQARSPAPSYPTASTMTTGPPTSQPVAYGYPTGPPPPYSPIPPQVPYPGAAGPPMPHPTASVYPPPGGYPPTSYPPQPYPAQPYPQQGYPPQPPPQAYPQPGYPPQGYPPTGPYPQTQPGYAGATPQAHYPQQPYAGAQPQQTVYVQQPTKSKSKGNKMLMGAGAGALGGAAMGYMLGRATGGFGHHGFGGWDSDHSWSSGGSFDCGFD